MNTEEKLLRELVQRVDRLEMEVSNLQEQLKQSQGTGAQTDEEQPQ